MPKPATKPAPLPRKIVPILCPYHGAKRKARSYWPATDMDPCEACEAQDNQAPDLFDPMERR